MPKVEKTVTMDETAANRYANRFTLPKSEGQPCINAIEKYCNYCQKKGHTRKECWSLNGRPEKRENASREAKMNKNKKGNKRETRKAIKNTNSQSSDEDETAEISKTPRTAAAYRVSHMKHSPSVDTGLDLISLPVREAERKRIEFLFDTGATISLIKLNIERRSHNSRGKKSN